MEYEASPIVCVEWITRVFSIITRRLYGFPIIFTSNVLERRFLKHRFLLGYVSKILIRYSTIFSRTSVQML